MASGSCSRLSVALGTAETKLNNDTSIVYSLRRDGELQEDKSGKPLCMGLGYR